MPALAEWVKVPGAHEAIVTEDVFHRANANISHFKQSGGEKNHSPFAGKLKCGCCGHALSRYRGKNEYFYCKGNSFNYGAGCFDGKLTIVVLKAIVLAVVKMEAGKTLDKYKKMKESICRASSDKKTALSELKQLAIYASGLKRRQVSLYEDYADGKFDKIEYLAEKKKCTEELSNAEARTLTLNTLIENAKNELESHCDEPLLRRILEAEDVTNEMLVLIERIVVYDAERVEVNFTFADSNFAIQ